MNASPITRLLGLLGLLGLAPIAGALALGWRSLPEAALAAAVWFAAVLAVSWLVRWVLESGAVAAERRVDARPPTVGSEAAASADDHGVSPPAGESSRAR